MSATLFLDKAQNVLKDMADNSVDSVVCDPPYGISFMNAKWDYEIPGADCWSEILRVLKPGGYLLAFAGTRTQHRMASAIEDAGFEIRDMIAWMYAQGMPKSGGLKPAHEPITVARKPGKSKFNIDACRVVRPSGDRTEYGVDGDEGSPSINAFGDRKRVAYVPSEGGRYPANIIHDGSDEVKDLFPNNNPGCKPHRVKASDETVERLQAKGWGFAGSDKIAGYDDGDNLSAARFFYCAKANKADRGEGNTHLTVKPTELMRYLCRLVTPEGGTVLDPFMGSGSTGKAALLEGFSFIGIECDSESFAIASRRVKVAA